jgi:hypothetical protein
MSDLSDYAAMVISHKTPSNRHKILRCTNKVEITLAEISGTPNG